MVCRVLYHLPGERLKECEDSERLNNMPKLKPITQHVQDSFESVSPTELSPTQRCKKPLAFLLQRISNLFVADKDPLPQESQQPNIPRPMTMSGLLAGRYHKDISQHSSSADEAGTKSSPENDKEDQRVDDPLFPDLRARLFAQLGIREEDTKALPEDIERIIASLSHIDVEKRIEATHALADLYAKLPAEKQMHARINLILMTWRDVDTYARIAAVKALGRTRMPDVSEALQVALRDEEQDVRAAAARALGNIPGKTPIVLLVAAVIREDEHWSVRAAAVRAMGDSGERAFLNTINLALDDEDDSVRIAAIHALAQLEGLNAAAHLSLIAQRDRQPHVKHAAILELEDMGTDDATDLNIGDYKRHTERGHE
jgi:HEAT repeats/HEAT repeat